MIQPAPHAKKRNRWILIYNYAFRLPFLQAACFFASLRDDEKSHFVRFSSESRKKHERCFQPVDGKMHNYKLIFMDLRGFKGDKTLKPKT